MSDKDETQKEANSVWSEFFESLEKCRRVGSELQQANFDALQKYNQALAKILQSPGMEQMNLVGEKWQKIMKDSGLDASMENLKQFGENWQKMMQQSGFDASMQNLKQVGDSWQRIMQNLWKQQ